MDSSDPSPSVTTLTSPFKPRVSLASPTLKKREQRNSQDMESDLTDLLQALNQENKQVIKPAYCSYIYLWPYISGIGILMLDC